MLKRILLVLDVTTASAQAERLAIDLALRRAASVRGLVLIDPGSISPPEPIPVGGDAFKQQKDQALLNRAREDGAALAQRFDNECLKMKVASDTRIVTGPALDGVVEASALCDLIAVGVDAAFEAADAEQVSTLVTRLLHHGARPVLAVPGRQHASTRSRTLVAYDGSVAAMRTLQLFAGLQLNVDLEAVVATVHSDQAEANRLSEVATRYLQERGYRAHAHAIVSDDDVADEVLGLGHRIDAHTIVAGAYGQRGWREWLIGGTTQKLLEQSDFPLFLHH